MFGHRLFLFLLFVGFLYDVSCKSRRIRKKCTSGLKLSSNGRCYSARDVFWGLGNPVWNAELWEMKQNLEKILGRAIDVPCYDGTATEIDGRQTIYCEVCDFNDTNRVECPESSQVSWDEYYKLCPPEGDFDATSCAKARCAGISTSIGDFVYYQTYDDGSICDCGAPFILTWTRGGNSVYRPARPSEVSMLEGVDEGSSVYANPGGGRYTRAWWLTDGGGIGSPSVPGPTTCSSRPDISSIFQNKAGTPSIPEGAGKDFYYEGCSDGRGLRCGGANKPCWEICDCRRNC